MAIEQYRQYIRHLRLTDCRKFRDVVGGGKK
jgi:hypothetical protein